MELTIIKEFIPLTNPIEAKKIQVMVGIYDKAHFSVDREKGIYFLAPINKHADGFAKKSAVIISYNADDNDVNLLAKLISALLKTSYRFTSDVSLNANDRTGIILDPDIFDVDFAELLKEELQKEENNFCFASSVN